MVPHFISLAWLSGAAAVWFQTQWRPQIFGKQLIFFSGWNVNCWMTSCQKNKSMTCLFMKLDCNRILLRKTGLTVETDKQVWNISFSHVKIRNSKRIGDHTSSKYPESSMAIWRRDTTLSSGTEYVFLKFAFLGYLHSLMTREADATGLTVDLKEFWGGCSPTAL